MAIYEIKDGVGIMENPWTNISWDNLIADCDKAILKNLPEKRRSEIQTSTLPEPFIGNPNSNVILLNMNPGEEDKKFYRSETWLKKMQATLRHETETFMWLEEEITDNNGQVHGGCKWWQKKTRIMREMKLPANFFVLEFFPYHSKKGIIFPKLPSDKYRNLLLAEAIEKEKLIVIMRARSKWYGIKENGLGEKLKEYDKKIILSNPLNPALSPNTMRDAWSLFKKEIEKGC